MRILTTNWLAATLIITAVSATRADEYNSSRVYQNGPVVGGPVASQPVASDPADGTESVLDVPDESVPQANNSNSDGTIVGDVYEGSFDGSYSGVLDDGYAGACRPWEYGNPALFYNFYAPNYCGGVPAQMYLCPHPVPALVGHTYYTYQPFMPHEFLYPHHRTYRSYTNEGRGITRTSAHWYRPPVATLFQGLHEHFRLAR